MMYRVAAKALLSLLLLSASPQGTAQASSFVEVGHSAETPSVVFVAAQGELPSQEAGGERHTLSASVVAMGADTIPPAPGEVASVDEPQPDELSSQPPAWTTEPVPALMRGAIVAEATLPEDS